MNRRLRLACTLLALLLCGLRPCHAQREDSLRIGIPPPFPPLNTPLQPKQAKGQMVFGKMGIEGLELSLPAEKDSVVPALSIEHSTRLHQKDYLKWEKQTYGGHLDLGEFTYSKNRSNKDSPYYPQGNEAKLPAPYPIHPAFENSPIGGINISWPPTKGDIWFKKHFGIDIRNYGKDVLIDSMGLKAPHEKRMLHMVDSLLIDRQSSPDEVERGLKKRIKDIKNSIREQARKELLDL